MFPDRSSILTEMFNMLRQELQDTGLPYQANDPVLQIVFRTFASSLEKLYKDREDARRLLIDELIEGLEVERRSALPAQAIVMFHSTQGIRADLPAGFELNVTGRDGKKLRFTLDERTVVGPVALSFAIAYQNQSCQLIGQPTLPPTAGQPNYGSIPVQLESSGADALYLALEGSPEALSELSIGFLRLGDGGGIIEGLHSEFWRMCNSHGLFTSKGFLRCIDRPSGMGRLEFLLNDGGNISPSAGPGGQPEMRKGIFGASIFQLPKLSQPSDWRCRFPKELAAVMAKLFPNAKHEFIETPRLWIKILLSPRNVPLAKSIEGIFTNCSTVSNIEKRNINHRFSTDGYSIPVSKSSESTEVNYFLNVASITSQTNEFYLRFSQPSAQPGVGRFGVRSGRLELQPAVDSNGKPEEWALISYHHTNGSAGNGLDTAEFPQLLSTKDGPSLPLQVLRSSQGGADEEDSARATARFSHAILSRNRIVTRQDLLVALEAFDHRIRGVQVRNVLVRDANGLHPLIEIKVGLVRNLFADSMEEERFLFMEELKRYLEGKLPLDIQLKLEYFWK